MIRKDQTSMMKAVFIGLSLLLAAALQACQQHKPEATHNLITSPTPHSVREKLREVAREVMLGQAENIIGGRKVTVTPCRNAKRTTLKDNAPLDSHHVIECGATKVEIINEELLVNEKSYGRLGEQTPVLVAHGKVLINGNEVQPVKQMARK
jgi:hypothetical protein